MKQIKSLMGCNEIVIELKKIGLAIASAHQEKAMKAALRPVEAALESHAPVGMIRPRGGRFWDRLHTSVRKKVIQYPQGRGVVKVFGIVGYTAPHAHVQELGWKQRHGRRVEGRHFAERAAAATKEISHQIYLRSLERSLKTEIRQAAAEARVAASSR